MNGLEKQFLELFKQKQYRSIVKLNWYVAISSGVDSLSLLYLLNSTFPKKNITAIYLNHQLNKDADLWQKNCQLICKKLKVDFVSKKLKNLKKFKQESNNDFKSYEFQARKERNQSFLKIIPKKSCLFLAHHIDDQIETFIFRLLRGANYQGLSGINEHSFLRKSKIRLIRPLLSLCFKKELYDYAKESKIQFFEDSSNLDLRFKRNLIRNKIIPILETVHPEVKKTLFRQIRQNKQSSEILTKLAKDDIQKNLIPKNLTAYLSLEKLRKFSNSNQTNRYRLNNLIYHFALNHWKYCFKNSASVDYFIDSFVLKSKEYDQFTLKKIKIIHYDGMIFAMRDDKLLLSNLDKLKLKNTLSCAKKNILPIHLKHGFLEYKLVDEGVWGIDIGLINSFKVIENKDFKKVKLVNKNHHQSVKKLFQEYNIPRFLRDVYPFLSLNEELVYLPNIGICSQSINSRKLLEKNKHKKVKIIWNYF